MFAEQIKNLGAVLHALLKNNMKMNMITLLWCKQILRHLCPFTVRVTIVLLHSSIAFQCIIYIFAG